MTGAALDPCMAVQVYLDLANGQEVEVVFIMGAAEARGLGSASEALPRRAQPWRSYGATGTAP